METLEVLVAAINKKLITNSNMKLITKPTLLLDEAKVRRNISVMSKKAKASQVDFRPHFKTHFSAEIGEWYREAGVNKITVSSIDMAVYFAENGWLDITIAFPVNILEIQTLNKLASKITLNLVVESEETVCFLNENMKHPANIWIKIDTGYGRAGVSWLNDNLVKKIISTIESPLKFQGLLAHFGHTYKEKNQSVIQGIYNVGVERLHSLKNKLQLVNCLISVGDTPSCSLVENFGDVTEIRPGNFAFYDLMQAQIGSCNISQIAVCMVCPVVAIHSEKNEIIIHGGAVHFSKDTIPDEQGKPIYGRMVKLTENSWENMPQENVFLKSVSQEHGIISASEDFIKKTKIGDLIGILPVHSCLTANLMKDYLTTDGRVIKSMNSVF